jgi:hypothetical protein
MARVRSLDAIRADNGGRETLRSRTSQDEANGMRTQALLCPPGHITGTIVTGRTRRKVSNISY